MIGYFSEGVAVLGVVKLLGSSVAYFYGSPMGYLLMISIVVGLLLLLLWMVRQQSNESFCEQKDPWPKALVATAAGVLVIGAPIVTQWQTFATPAQTAHLECSVFSPTSQKTCFAAWVKKTQMQQKAS